MVIVWVKLEYIEWCVVKFRMKHSLVETYNRACACECKCWCQRNSGRPDASVLAEYSKVLPRVKQSFTCLFYSNH